MSYYTYFKPKKDETYTSEELNNKIKKYRKDMKEQALIIKLMLIDAYYKEDVRDIISNIQFYFGIYKWECMEANRLEWISYANSELDKYGEVAINHANCDNKESLQEDINSTNEYIDKQFEELMILTRIKFSNDSKEYNNQTFNDWLKSSYISDIEEVLNAVEELSESIAKKQFMLDNFDTKETEEEHLNKE